MGCVEVGALLQDDVSDGTNHEGCCSSFKPILGREDQLAALGGDLDTWPCLMPFNFLLYVVKPAEKGVICRYCLCSFIRVSISTSRCSNSVILCKAMACSNH